MNLYELFPASVGQGLGTFRILYQSWSLLGEFKNVIDSVPELILSTHSKNQGRMGCVSCLGNI